LSVIASGHSTAVLGECVPEHAPPLAGAAPADTITPLPGAAAATVAWRAGGRLNVTVIAKATFAFAPD
jgi:hypothetical protein